jgi:hypothetical protein
LQYDSPDAAQDPEIDISPNQKLLSMQAKIVGNYLPEQ